MAGRLTFVVLDDNHTVTQNKELASKAKQLLEEYVDSDGSAVSTPDDLFDDRLKDLSGSLKWRLSHPGFDGEVNLVDRRVVGGDWLRTPAPAPKMPVRFAFASIKGGVGRSTALCVIAAHFAARGRRVLAIDMDLEAPGLGNMLLPGETLPEFGLLDWLAERSIGPVEDEFYADLVAPSWLGGGHGRVDVIPAIGRRSLRNPTNVLAKLARAYLGGPAENHETPSFVREVRVAIDRMSNPLSYDVVLIDSRAGLHETTAAAILGLGAHVFFFGENQPQTFAGYELLLAQLSIITQDRTDDWRDRLHFVQSKAPKDNPANRRAFAQRMETLQRNYLWPQRPDVKLKPNVEELADTFEVEWIDGSHDEIPISEDDEGPWPVIAMMDDDRFRSVDPIADPDALSEPAYLIPFNDLIGIATGIVDESFEEPGAV